MKFCKYIAESSWLNALLKVFKKMHLLVVSQNFWPESFRINELVKLLKKRGHEVTILTGLPNYPQGKFYPNYRFRVFPFQEIWENMKIIRVPLVSRGSSSNLRLILNYLSFMFFATVYAPFFCKKKYDAIFVFQTSPITQALPAIVLKKFFKMPVFMWVQDLWPESLSATGKVKSRIIHSIVDKFVAFIYRRCDRILIQSQGFLPYITRYSINPEVVYYYPNYAEDFYNPLSVLKEQINKYNLPSGFKVMYAGNIGAAQAVNVIIGAAIKLRDYPDIKWVIAGDGSERSWLIKQIKENELENNVFWIGSYPSQEMPYLFSLADIMLATLRKSEIFALTVPSRIQSYMACAKPIVVSIDGEACRIVEEAEAGIAVEAENPDSLAEAVLALYKTSPQKREEMGWKGRAYFENFFSQELLVNKLEDFLLQQVTKKTVE